MNERKAVKYHDRLVAALQLPLLFYSGGAWHEGPADKWREITGNDNATTRGLCDHIRALLAEIEASRD